MKNYYLLANHGLGDIIMSLPLIASAVKESKLTVMIKSNVEKSFLEFYLKDDLNNLNVIVLHKNKIKRMMQLANFVASNKSFDYGIIGFNINYKLASYFIRFLNAKIKVGQAKDKYQSYYHIRLNELSLHKVEYTKIQTRLVGLPLVEYKWHSDLPKLNQICIALASGGQPPNKDLSIETAVLMAIRFAEVNPLKEIVILGGPDNLAFNAKIEASLLAFKVVNLTGKTSFESLINILSQSQKIITTCNGISHIASLVDIDILGVYGPTDPSYTGPYTDNLISLTRKLSCSPCYKPEYTRGCGNPICMKFNKKEVMTLINE